MNLSDKESEFFVILTFFDSLISYKLSDIFGVFHIFDILNILDIFKHL